MKGVTSGHVVKDPFGSDLKNKCFMRAFVVFKMILEKSYKIDSQHFWRLVVLPFLGMSLIQVSEANAWNYFQMFKYF